MVLKALGKRENAGGGELRVRGSYLPGGRQLTKDMVKISGGGAYGCIFDSLHGAKAADGTKSKGFRKTKCKTTWGTSSLGQNKTEEDQPIKESKSRNQKGLPIQILLRTDVPEKPNRPLRKGQENKWFKQREQKRVRFKEKNVSKKKPWCKMGTGLPTDGKKG